MKKKIDIVGYLPVLSGMVSVETSLHTIPIHVGPPHGLLWFPVFRSMIIPGIDYLSSNASRRKKVLFAQEDSGFFWRILR